MFFVYLLTQLRVSLLPEPLNRQIMKVRLFICVFALVCWAASPLLSQESEKEQEIMDKAGKTREQILEKDPGLSNFFSEAYGYVIIPTVGKGGLIVGGAYGKGILYKAGEPVGVTEMTQVSIGAQIGGLTYSEVIFFKTEEEYKVFTTGRFEVAAQITALAVTAGVSKTMAYSDGVAILTLPKGGVMADVSAGGQKFSFTPFN